MDVDSKIFGFSVGASIGVVHRDMPFFGILKKTEIILAGRIAQE
jgi:hypothetical protein